MSILFTYMFELFNIPDIWFLQEERAVHDLDYIWIICGVTLIEDKKNTISASYQSYIDIGCVIAGFPVYSACHFPRLTGIVGP